MGSSVPLGRKTSVSRCVFSILALALALAACESERRGGGGTTPPPNPPRPPNPSSCGNGRIDTGERCDATQLNGSTCLTLGLGDGTLACSPNCSNFDTASCAAPPTCGNNTRDAAEVCDGTDLAGATCASINMGTGTLACASNCGAFDTSSCTAAAMCGNNLREGSELCDGNDLAGASCTSLNLGTGNLTCASDCRSHNTSACTPTCDPECPNGWTCGPGGICEGGDPTRLLLELTTHRVQGSVTVNGVPAALTETCTIISPYRAYVIFEEIDRGYRFGKGYVCSDFIEGIPFDLEIPTGTYRVLVGGSAHTNLPAAEVVAITSLDVNGPQLNLTPNIQSHRIQGTVFVDGQPAALNEPCTIISPYRAYVVFEETTYGYRLGKGYVCNDFVDGIPFDLQIPNGTYKVFVGGTDETNLPIDDIVVLPSLTVSGPMPNLPLSISTHRVAGQVTVDGQPAALRESCTIISPWRAYVVFEETTYGYRFGQGYVCSDFINGIPFDLQIPAGTYKVLVGGTDQTNLPTDEIVGIASLTVSASNTNIAVNLITHRVQGSVTVNGAPAALRETCTIISPWRAYVVFEETTYGYRFDQGYVCNDFIDGIPFDLRLPAGTYRARVGGTDQTNLPTDEIIVLPSLTVSAPMPNLTLGISSHRVRGSVTVNGVAAALNEACTIISPWRAYVVFEETTYGYRFDQGYVCADFITGIPFDLVVAAGTYRVKVGGTDHTNLPLDEVVVMPGLTINGDVANLALNVETRRVAGTVHINGAPASLRESCTIISPWRAFVSFEEPNLGYRFTRGYVCNDFVDGIPFDLEVAPGTYTVKVGGTDHTTLPSDKVVAVRSLRIP